MGPSVYVWDLVWRGPKRGEGISPKWGSVLGKSSQQREQGEFLVLELNRDNRWQSQVCGRRDGVCAYVLFIASYRVRLKVLNTLFGVDLN